RPSVLSTTPVTGATDVALNSPVGLVFSEPVNQALTSAGLAFVDCDASATCAGGTVAVAGDANWLTTSSLTFSAAHTLNPNHWYGLQLNPSVADVTGNVLDCAGASVVGGGRCTWTFQT